jgi:hypothetical protein
VEYRIGRSAPNTERVQLLDEVSGAPRRPGSWAILSLF